jgi:hypothetical protein
MSVLCTGAEGGDGEAESRILHSTGVTVHRTPLARELLASSTDSDDQTAARVKVMTLLRGLTPSGVYGWG